MQERIEALEREVMELRVELRVLQQVLRNALDSIDGEPGRFLHASVGWSGR